MTTPPPEPHPAAPRPFPRTPWALLRRLRGPKPRRLGAVLLTALAGSLAVAATIPLTPEDFRLSGTQIGDVSPAAIRPSTECQGCHGDYDPQNEPYSTWAGSLMGLAGRDPLFFAQMTNANQDVANVGSFCLRCHVPLSFVTGHAAQPNGSTLDALDRDGVNCHFCHSLVDPNYQPGVSPPEDQAILAGLAAVPGHAANAMFVLDPQGRRRGPYDETDAPHLTIASPFHRASALCGTCHDVGNVAVSRLPNGSYRYNLPNLAVPDENPWTQFPLERTYTEWKLSSFAAGGVDMGGRFGGARGPVVSTCQDCHMPTETARGCLWGRERTDLARHEFAGAAAPSLDLIAAHTAGDPSVDPALIAAGRARAVSMLERAASLELSVDGAAVVARVVNQSGHKLPTGHIEGRRVWLNLRFLDGAGTILREHGHYDPATSHLDETTTTVYEMQVGLSPDAAGTTGLPPGVTTHMALADTIEKDTRIPPRGYQSASFEAAGAPAVGIVFADGQYWHDGRFPIPRRATRVEATVYYQSLTRHYIEALRDGNVTDDWGTRLHALWEATGRGAPLPMASSQLFLTDTIFTDGFQ
ncbi:MAG TPA: hypothetical protein VJU18_17760 [Vicinamibacteria bacterium]|nr:hypothetical protein [Vicinamibacteria bacterium]